MRLKLSQPNSNLNCHNAICNMEAKITLHFEARISKVHLAHAHQEQFLQFLNAKKNGNTTQS